MEPGTRPLPAWFDDAKLGIFVHWTAAAVPAFAPVTDSPFDLAAEGGWEEAMRCSPYVEWYQNSIAIEGSPAALHHAEVHGNRPYDDFVAQFLAGHAGWQPEPWADLFAPGRGALRRARHQAPRRRAALAERHAQPAQGAVGDRRATSSATSRRPCAPATCASAPTTPGGLDWTFGGLPITDLAAMFRAIPQSPEYLAYADAHWHELIERYRPDVLWNDIGYPAAADLDGALRPLLRGGARRRRQQPVRLDGAVVGRRALRLRHPRVLHRRRPEPQVGEHPRHRHVVRLQPPGGRRQLPVARTRSCGCSSTSWPTAATCSSTSARRPTASSRGCRPSGCSPSAGGCAPTATRSTAPVRGRGPTARPARATTCASPPATARSTPSCCGTPSSDGVALDVTPAPGAERPPARPRRAARRGRPTGDGCAVTLPGRPADAPALALRLSAVA